MDNPDNTRPKRSRAPVITHPPPEREVVVLPPNLVRATAVDPVVQDWLLDPIIAAGVLNIVAGAPGGSKTSWLIDLAARAAKGTLKGSYEGKPTNVLYLSREDSAEKTLVPKLIAANAWGELAEPGDADVILLSPNREDSYAFPRDTDKMAQLVKQHDIGVIVLDSLIAFMDTNRSLHGNYQAAVESITPLAEMCAKAGNVTLIGVMHLRKDADIAGLNAIIGSIGIGATARHVVMVGNVPLTDSRVVGVIKSNIGGEGIGEVFDVSWPIVGFDRDANKPIRASRITFVRPATEDEVEAMLEKRKKQSTSARDLLILSGMRDGVKRSTNDLLTKSPEIGIQQRQLRRTLQQMASRGLFDEDPGNNSTPARFAITERGLSMVNALNPPAIKEGEQTQEEREDEIERPRKVIQLFRPEEKVEDDSVI